ncbi:N-6 DNA methylase [Thalassospira permensis]|uniref:site-specific DNA-methyltransferase (adenine-specific) n=1 Tax=Thalassospira permensis NBRC 106175 TaxID=1353532 RepID=A0ABR4TLT5_9PROT|nr:N-6 DNA methylase [Thalassospira permensis]KEO55622.1 hypothetical protein SMB34_04230 [Thalassospira permensis NBRC 106175]
MPADNIFNHAYTERLFHDLKSANTESAKKERFLQYLTIAFSDDNGAQQLVSALALGAERVVANIPRGERKSYGRADTQTETIIIEWEKDLAKTGEHAKHQLEEYLEGNWRSGQNYRFILIATDGIRWVRYAPDWSRLENKQFSLGSSFRLRETKRFELNASSFDEFPFFLDELLFSSHPKNATLENIQYDFGDTSRAFINSIVNLQLCMSDITEQSELQVAFEQWRRFLSIAYGRFDDSPNMFLVHTYLSVFAKFIAYSVITNKPIIEDETIYNILNGTIFNNLNIERFVEDDFFHWVAATQYFNKLRPMFREINRQLQEYDFSKVEEDVLKGVYQELIDLETRHALGEYYTPDWLCENLVESLAITQTSKFLDPACGSGSFLRAIVARLRRDFPQLEAENIASQVVGIDIHPLSVLISKTNILLSIKDIISKSSKPITLHIYLANSLLVPRGSADLFSTHFQISIDNRPYTIDLSGVQSADDFDTLISFCDEMVHRFDEVLDRENFIRLISANISKETAKELPSQLYDVYTGMKLAHQQGRDSIWKFILQNSYKPVFLMHRFDFVLGNPPWLTYADITNGEYQTSLKSLSDHYSVTPANRANFPHLEIAAIFLAHSVNYFLRPSGQLAFVLPRSFLSADQHENMRSGQVHGVKLVEGWDLQGVTPLFRVPSCVLIAIKDNGPNAVRKINSSGIIGRKLTGRLRRSQAHWEEVKTKITSEPIRLYYSRLQGTRGRARSALTTEPFDTLLGGNAYSKKFHQGATIVPRNLFFVETNQIDSDSSNLNTRVINLTTSVNSDREAKKPWKGQIINARAEGKLLYRTAISRNVIPFALTCPPLVLLPLIIDHEGKSEAKFVALNSEELLARGYREASKWFYKAERIWDELKTDGNRKKKIDLTSYLNWQSKLTNQKPNARFLVLYTSSASDASAVLVDRSNFDYPFIVDHKTYWCECETEEEGHYLTAYINSGYANFMIKEFQSRGLFGPRDIHKTIVKLPFPRFNKTDDMHLALSYLGRECSILASSFSTLRNLNDLGSHALGRVRANLREQLRNELEKIDDLVEALSTGRSHATVAATRRARKAKRHKMIASLFDFEGD